MHFRAVAVAPFTGAKKTGSAIVRKRRMSW